MDIEITKKDGTKFKLNDFGFKVKDIVVESIEIDDEYIENENLEGRILVSSKYVKRKIHVSAFFIVNKLSDIANKRDLLYSLVVSKEPIYLRELRRKEKFNYPFREPLSNDYQSKDEYGFNIYENEKYNNDTFINNKRYKVKYNGLIQPNQKDNKVNFTLEFETVELPFCESVGTSLDLVKNNEITQWATDYEIPWNINDNKRRYTFHGVNSGSVFYHGNVKNNQYNQYKKITIVIGEETDKFIWNLSHSEQMVISDVKLKSGDVITYDGFKVFKNDIEISTKTNISQPKFAYGFNNFEINQVINKITFDMKFYFK